MLHLCLGQEDRLDLRKLMRNGESIFGVTQDNRIVGINLQQTSDASKKTWLRRREPPAPCFVCASEAQMLDLRLL